MAFNARTGERNRKLGRETSGRAVVEGPQIDEYAVATSLMLL